MCKHPIKIASPKLKAGTYLDGVDKRYLVVPCGHCEECQDKRTKDLIFRAYHEYLWTISHKGFVLFQTFTYSTDNIPYSGEFYFFCKKDVQKCFKRLRKRLDDDNIVCKFKYLVTSEYGTSYYRPHYHILFYVTGNITPAVFDSYVQNAWKSLGDVYTKSCKIGRTDERIVSKRLINSIYGIKYVCKYIFKGCETVKAVKAKGFSDISRFVHDYCFSPDSHIMFKDLQDWQLVKIWNAYVTDRPELKDFQLLPFYLQSKGFGESFLYDCEYEDLFDIVQLPSKNKLGFTKFTLPNYYIRKCFYDYDPITKRYRINELGLDYKKSVDSKICDSYEDFVRSNSSLNESVFKLVVSKDVLSNYHSFSNYLVKMLNGRTIKDFINYSVFLKDRPISPIHMWLIPRENTNAFLSMLNEFCDIVSHDNHLAEYADESPFVRLISRDLWGIEFFDGSKDEILTYNYLPCFRGFDELYNVLQKMKIKLNEFKSAKIRADIEAENQAKLAKSIINPQSAVIY